MVAVLAFPLIQQTPNALGRLIFGGGAGERSLYLKLPLDEPRFHWKFWDQDALLAGSLEIAIHGDQGRDTVLTVFSEGSMAPGWEPIETSRGEGEIYFGFIGDVQVWTDPEDSIVVRMSVVGDLDGIGRYHRGVLRRGEYEAVASYSVLTGHPRIGVFEQEDPRAYIGCWRAEWSLDVTADEGWRGAGDEDSDRVVGGRLGDLLEFAFGDRGTDGYRCAE